MARRCVKGRRGTLAVLATLLGAALLAGGVSSGTSLAQTASGSIVIKKAVEPAGAGDQSFEFDGACGRFSLIEFQSHPCAALAAGSYDITELDPGPNFKLGAITCDDDNSSGDVDARTAHVQLAPGETVTCTFTNLDRRQLGRIIVRKVTEPAIDSTDFTFTAGGGLSPSSFTLTGGGSRTFADVAPGSAYSLAESVPEGWLLASASCDDGSPVSSISLSAGETVTCTFRNTKRGTVTLTKTTNGVADPSKDIAFVLTGPGFATGGITRSTFGDQDGALQFGSMNLVPGQTYKICEVPVPAGFTSFWKLDGVIVTPYNPDASRTPPEDLGTRCYDFQVTPGQTRAFLVDNSRPGGDPRTIGYWKNWNRCTSGNQARTAAKNGGAGAGFFLVEDLLPQLVGDFSVATCQQAVKLLSKQDQGGKNKASDAAYELGAQFLAARFNVSAGAEVCFALQQAVVDAQSLLDSIGFTGSGDYLGSKSTSPRRSQALSLASTIDRYNNGSLC